MAGTTAKSNGSAPERSSRLDADERRAQIIAAARSVFGERHYGDVSLEEVATKAGVARGLINHYFGTKRDLYVEVVREMVWVPPPPVPEYVQGTTVEERIRESTSAWLDVIGKNRATWLDSMRTQAHGDPEIAAIFEEAREEASRRMVAVLGLGPVDDVPKEQMAMLRAYGGLAEAGTVQWLQHKRLTRTQLEALLVESATRMAKGLLDTVLAAETQFQSSPKPQARPTRSRHTEMSTATTTSPVSGLTDEQQDFVEAIRDFAKRECGTAEQREQLTEKYTELHNHELVGKLGELGWLGASVPEEFGGIGGGMVDACLFLEEGFRGLLPMAGYPVTLITAGAVQKFGTDEQKEQVIGGMCNGRVSAIAMSEPEAGSDVGNLSCRAEKSNGGYVLNGQKTWISAAHIADQILTIVRTEKTDSKHEGLTMFLVPRETDGLEINGIDTMGGKEVNDMFFTDCYLDDSTVVGQVGGGWMQLMSGLNVERLIVAANAIGVAQRAFDDVLAYIKERKQFGRPIGSFQAISHRIADLATEIEATRLLIYDVARKVDAAPMEMLPREASMTKLKATQLVKDVTLEGMQMMGGYGYATEYDMERHVRSALVMPIYAGTNEIQREIIAKTYGL